MAVAWHAVRRSGVRKRETRRRDRLRADRAGGDPDAQGARGADGDRQRLLAGAPCPGRAVRRRRGRRPGRRVAVDAASSRAATSPTPTTSSTSRSARWASCARCRCCRGGRCCAPPRLPARPPAVRSSSSASASRGSSTRSSTSAPLATRVVVVGVCMEPDTIRPAMAINKEIDLRFVFAYQPHEFREALHLIADGQGRPDAADHRHGRPRRRRRRLRRPRRPRAARQDPDRPGQRCRDHLSARPRKSVEMHRVALARSTGADQLLRRVRRRGVRRPGLAHVECRGPRPDRRSPRGARR